MSGKSFEEIALPHLDVLYRYARRLTPDAHAAEDLVQDTYLKAYKAFGKFELREFGVRPWLLKILHNTFLNGEAKKKHAAHSTEPQVLDTARAAAEIGSVEGDLQIDLDGLDDEVKRALEQLSPDFRSILLLWASMELSYQEIAEILSVPIGTVMSRLHRARQQMMTLLADYKLRGRGEPLNGREAT
ncbi:MAG: sigma-70 family RNA polymerase sigma factor [Phycisphaerae bacterium]|nr:sigma-70 family RNA polymerase sigma factor [Phycisphaerae bacterium]